ncbi:PREDICTED: oxidation resistance protein 1 isoform X2 [Lupinus angustifolius]|uniref:oxidation resistance protein 1 isoform X2 n=1 Tax=Lupinus angustifolius TaxID=3871 RepID=UPI00092ED5B5|nr:PREDICTED: oxidation resistance protein 1 isoform X2 [Lupinus angustifolius]
MGKIQFWRIKAANLVSDLTTVLFNPISDNNKKPSKPLNLPPSVKSKGSESEGSSRTSVDNNEDGLVDGPDTSSFAAFLLSLLSPSDDKAAKKRQNDDKTAVKGTSIMKENRVAKKSLLSRSKQSIGRVIYQTTRMGGIRDQDRNNNVEMTQIKPVKEPVVVPLVDDLPRISEPSKLVSDSIRKVVYDSLPTLIHGRKWMLLYSTWKHGISLSTLYRRSMLWPGISLLVVGDRKGAVFGGLVEAPLIASNKRKYQGTNNSYVFTNISGHPVIYRPTGVNRYFTLCTTESLAIGGGGHFALYLDGDLLNGSSSVSDTYGNPCLAHSQDFDVKEVELWGFVLPSKYEEILALSKKEAPGICRW